MHNIISVSNRPKTCIAALNRTILNVPPGRNVDRNNRRLAFLERPNDLVERRTD